MPSLRTRSPGSCEILPLTSRVRRRLPSRSEEGASRLAKAISALVQFAASRKIKPSLFQFAKRRLQRRIARSPCALAAFGSATIALVHSVVETVKHRAPPDSGPRPFRLSESALALPSSVTTSVRIVLYSQHYSVSERSQPECRNRARTATISDQRSRDTFIFPGLDGPIRAGDRQQFLR